MLRRKKTMVSFDPQTQEPVIRCSICTGEQTLCFREKATGRVEEIMLVRDQRELAEFCRRNGVPEPVEKTY